MDSDRSHSPLGLLSDAASRAKKMRSLSIRTADGHCVSILNDDHNQSTGFSSASSTSVTSIVANRQYSVPEMTPDSSPLVSSRVCSRQMTPTRLPSLSALIHAVNMADHFHDGIKKHSGYPEPLIVESHSHCTHQTPSSMPLILPCTTQVVPRTQSKRKYICSHHNCGKAFTTSGHLSRHYRIHTGEKNYHCLYPGCQSRFSRQDNMMQHYRTHLSPRGRRSRAPRVSNEHKQLTEESIHHLAAQSTNSVFHPYTRNGFVHRHSPQMSSHMSQWQFF